MHENHIIIANEMDSHCRHIQTSSKSEAGEYGIHSYCTPRLIPDMSWSDLFHQKSLDIFFSLPTLYRPVYRQQPLQSNVLGEYLITISRNILCIPQMFLCKNRLGSTAFYMDWRTFHHSQCFPHVREVKQSKLNGNNGI